MTTVFSCLSDIPAGVDPVEAIIGCGTVFIGEPDDEGIVDCRQCGIWFDPRIEGELAQRPLCHMMSANRRNESAITVTKVGP